MTQITTKEISKFINKEIFYGKLPPKKSLKDLPSIYLYNVITAKSHPLWISLSPKSTASNSIYIIVNNSVFVEVYKNSTDYYSPFISLNVETKYFCNSLKEVKEVFKFILENPRFYALTSSTDDVLDNADILYLPGFDDLDEEASLKDNLDQMVNIFPSTSLSTPEKRAAEDDTFELKSNFVPTFTLENIE